MSSMTEHPSMEYPTISGALEEFYDLLNQENTRDRELFTKYLTKMILAAKYDFEVKRFKKMIEEVQ